jgi:hypothetical protein
MLKQVFLVLVASYFVLQVVEVASLRPSITLHRESDPEDSTFSITTIYEEPSLGGIKNLDKVHSVCKTGK